MYSDGRGVPQDDRQAAAWFALAAAQGNPKAQFSLGGMYEDGAGVPRDVAKAVQLYEAGARQGHPGAQRALGLCYEFGQGVPRDREKALSWLRKASTGDRLAQVYAAWLSRPDTPALRDSDALRDYIASNTRPAAPKGGGAGAGGKTYSIAPGETQTWIVDEDFTSNVTGVSIVGNGTATFTLVAEYPFDKRYGPDKGLHPSLGWRKPLNTSRSYTVYVTNNGPGVATYILGAQK
jgi:hypothetical protein